MKIRAHRRRRQQTNNARLVFTLGIVIVCGLLLVAERAGVL